MEAYIFWMLVVGVAFFAAAWLPHLLRGWPLSAPMFYVGFGALIFSLPLGFRPAMPLDFPKGTEHLTEIVVIVSLMGVGLKIDRPLGWRNWNCAWRLLGIAMPLTILGFAVLGWGVLGLTPAAALLLGAVLAPTDPVLAGEVQVAAPMGREEDEVRLALTTEAGLNDGLAFPFTNLAVGLAAANSGWVFTWVWRDVLLKIGVGVASGVLLGYLLGLVIFRTSKKSRPSEVREGIVSIAATLIVYAVTELLHGYGFLAVFLAAVTIRHQERNHEYHKILHDVAENLERMLMALVLLLFGGALVGGLLSSLTWQAAAVGLALLLVIRPAAGWMALLGSGLPGAERLTMAFFGIRGVGSIYYAAYALNEEYFAEAKPIWAVVGFVVLCSTLLHGAAAAPWMQRLESRLERGVAAED